MLWSLWKEVFCKYRDAWLEKRFKMGWQQNLALIVFVLALVVLLVIVFKVFL